MLAIARKFSFSAAHQLSKTVPEGHKCSQIHGHNWEGEFKITASDELQYGMIVDFGILKELLQREVVGLFDHKFICPSWVTPVTTPVVLIPADPTVEYLSAICTFIMAQALLEDLEVQVFPLITELSTTLWETPNSYGTFTLQAPFNRDRIENEISKVRVLTCAD